MTTTVEPLVEPLVEPEQEPVAAVLPAQESWTEPTGVNPRGTLVILPGSGENAAVYQRFARRLAADAYRVQITTGPQEAADVLGTDLVTPVVLVGSDTGALDALRLAEDLADRVHALVLAGVALDRIAGSRDPIGDQDAGELSAGELDSEIASRTACPAHRAVLSSVLPTTRSVPPTGLRVDGRGSGLGATAVTVPVLAVHGVDDTISPIGAALDFYRRAGVAEVHQVVGGLHDILNDVTHRSVAATTVLFLERLRLDGGVAPIVEPTVLSA